MSAAESLASAPTRFIRAFSGKGEKDLVPQTRLSGPMPWVIAIMVALTVIALGAGLALRNTVVSAEAELKGGVTVQIVEPRGDKRDEQVQAALARLRTMPDIVTLRPVPDDEVDALIEPWLGTELDRGVASAVPVPALIDARFENAISEERIAGLQTALAKVAPSARVDAQSGWLEPVYDAIASLQLLAMALVLLLAFALAAAVLLAARNALGTNRETIEIVHLLGGTDTQIARVFQRSIGVDAATGGLVGLVLAIVVILFLGGRFSDLGAGLVNNGALDWLDWVLLALVPVAATLLAMLTARFTVLHALRKML
ncbi:MAG: cell division protein [Sphingomonadaceae bacterium]